MRGVAVLQFLKHSSPGNLVKFPALTWALTAAATNKQSKIILFILKINFKLETRKEAMLFTEYLKTTECRIVISLDFIRFDARMIINNWDKRASWCIQVRFAFVDNSLSRSASDKNFSSYLDILGLSGCHFV